MRKYIVKNCPNCVQYDTTYQCEINNGVIFSNPCIDSDCMLKRIIGKNKEAVGKCDTCSEHYTDNCLGFMDFEKEGDCTHCGIGTVAYFAKEILSEFEIEEVKND